MSAKRKIRCARHVAWVVEPHGIVLLPPAHRRRRELPFPEAAGWVLATRRRPDGANRPMMEVIAGIAPHEARTLVDSCLAQWLAEGWLTE